jgi:hypothetical protein
MSDFSNPRDFRRRALSLRSRAVVEPDAKTRSQMRDVAERYEEMARDAEDIRRMILAAVFLGCSPL